MATRWVSRRTPERADRGGRIIGPARPICPVRPLRFPMPTVLITGTSTGIGLETALAAADEGWTTVATMRDLSKAGPLRERGGGFPIDVRQLDVTDHEAIASVVAGVVADHGTLDAVINN